MAKRDEKGRLMERPANSGSKPNSIKYRLEEMRRILAPALPRMLKKLTDLAETGDVQALKLYLTYMMPPSSISTTIVEGCSDLIRMPPDQRLNAINKRVMTGKLAIEVAEKLAALASREIEAQVSEKVRKINKLLADGANTQVVNAELKKIKTGDWKPDRFNYDPEPDYDPNNAPWLN